MLSSNSNNVGSLQPETVNHPSQGRELVSGWSPDYIEEFFRATKLCNVCQVMLGPEHFWKLSAKYKAEGPIEETHPSAVGPFEHHLSYKSLLHSLELGCHVCIMIYNQWAIKSFHWSIFYPSGEPHSLWLEAAKANGKILIHSDPLIGPSRMVYDTAHARIDFVEFAAAKSFIIPCSQRRNHLAMAKNWAEACQQETSHEECAKYRCQPRRKPTRLLYLNPRLPGLVQLITTSSLVDYRYATLSHRWGSEKDSEPPKLSIYHTAGDADTQWISVERLQAGISQSSLPRTFRDAMQIARFCRLEYMWIDCLCIVQDIDDHGKNLEWSQEAVKMGDIYAGGIFNIAAVDAEHSDQGLFPKQSDRQLLGIRPKHPPDGRGPQVMFQHPRSHFQRKIIESGLMSRGWVYQEIILAPANLFCTVDQMWWSCTHASLSQAFPIHSIGGFWKGQPRSFKDSIRVTKTSLMACKGQSSVAKIWHSVLSYYAPTAVTYHDDRLIAIKGISDWFRSLYPVPLQEAEYHSGLWSTDILRQLSWASADKPARQQTKYYIPTWSPLKRSARIWNWSVSETSLLLPNNFLSMRVCDLDEFGRAADWRSSEIHLRGALVNMTMSPPSDPSYTTLDRIHPTGHQDAAVNLTWDDPEDLDLNLAALASGDQIQALLLTVGIRRWSHKSYIRIDGILLKLFRDQNLRPPQVVRWVRCGSFSRFWDLEEDRLINQANLSNFEVAFNIARNYGERWVLTDTGDKDHEWDLRQDHLHETELEHVFIV